MRAAAACALALALLFVPAAFAAGPAISYTVTSGTAGDNSWYRSDVTVKIDVTGATSTSCLVVNTFRKSSDTYSCTASDGISTVQVQLQFKIDTDAPTVTSSATSREPDQNGWFSHPLTATFAGSDATSGIASCSSANYEGPDSAAGSLSGTCRDNAGNVSAPTSFPVKYDATPPTANGVAARAPDGNGWFNHAVAVTFAGTDATSGIASCAGATKYAGPDSAGVTLKGSCVDQAGNETPASFPLKYDATAPSLKAVAVAAGDRAAMLTWKQPPDTKKVEVVRSPGRRGTRPSPVYSGDHSRFRDSGLKPGVAYRYTLTSLDEAGNRAVTRVRVQLRTLYAPAPGTRVHAGSVLRWVEEKTATYYNVQLFRNGKKVLSVWPLGATLKVPRAWSFEGHRYKLVRGTYRWYVWPGIGARSKAKYGRLLGGSFFRVA